ncbi:hypothetical protein TBR22_A24160 [Luteitalea sp. TBR-22]|uniref:dienelactone hydrolase family protein n=1 Tax=Luteitalea sp. TBR-22 TaxID=2802971 RepID=UPI001AF6CDB1|nr:acetylxylan esterase [Luteitalea sp. TBR-22]BCS33189.1 hypothetical protein TBR22_A24160 [Luteitalea sp. TBR-22]
MLTALAASAAGLLAAHEFLARGSGRGGGAWRWARRGVLLLLLVVTAIGADRAGLQARLGHLVSRERETRSPVLDGTGDPFLVRQAEAQVPVHPYPEGRGREAIEAWQRETRDAVRARARFAVAADQPSEVTVVSREAVGDVTRTLVTFRAADGTPLPAFVHEPTRGGRRAGILVVPGHGRGARATAGMVGKDYQHGAALELARRGFVTITPELRGFGLLSSTGAPMHRAVAATALQSGTFYKAVVVDDLGRALTVLSRWQGVDPARLGVAGASLGGEIAVMLAVVDDRVRVVASQSYGGDTGPARVAGNDDDEAEQTPHGCHTFPGINTLLWQEDWFRLLAPRAVLVSRGRTNTPRKADAFKVIVGRAYADVGQADRFTFAVEPGGHEFFVEPVAAFFERWL